MSIFALDNTFVAMPSPMMKAGGMMDSMMSGGMMPGEA